MSYAVHRFTSNFLTINPLNVNGPSKPFTKSCANTQNRITLCKINTFLLWSESKINVINTNNKSLLKLQIYIIYHFNEKNNPLEKIICNIIVYTQLAMDSIHCIKQNQNNISYVFWIFWIFWKMSFVPFHTSTVDTFV